MPSVCPAVGSLIRLQVHQVVRRLRACRSACLLFASVSLALPLAETAHADILFQEDFNGHTPVCPMISRTMIRSISAFRSPPMALTMIGHE